MPAADILTLTTPFPLRKSGLLVSSLIKEHSELPVLFLNANGY